MKTPLLMHGCWALISIAAFALGAFVARGPASLVRSLSNSQRSHPQAASSIEEKDKSAGADPSSSDAGFVPHTEALTGAAACGQMLVALTEPSRATRASLVARILGQITVHNWSDVMNAWVHTLQTQGPINEEEWVLMLERIGEVAGADALESVLAGRKNEVFPGISDTLSKSILKGWAASRAQEAVNWYQKQPEDLRQQFALKIIEGVARIEPKLAFAIAVESPRASWPDRIRLILENANAGSGLRGGDEFLQESSNEVPGLFKAVLFEQISARAYGRMAVRNALSDALPWIEPYIGQTFVTPEVLARFLDMAVANSGTSTLAWLDLNAPKLTIEQAEAAYTAVGKSWFERKPTEFKSWVNANGSHKYISKITVATPSVATSLP